MRKTLCTTGVTLITGLITGAVFAAEPAATGGDNAAGSAMEMNGRMGDGRVDINGDVSHDHALMGPSASLHAIRARQQLQAGNRIAAAQELRLLAMCERRDAADAKEMGHDDANLVQSKDDVKNLADRVASGDVKSVTDLDPPLARSVLAVAEYHQKIARMKLNKSEPVAAGYALKESAQALETVSAVSNWRTGQTDSAISDARRQGEQLSLGMSAEGMSADGKSNATVAGDTTLTHTEPARSSVEAARTGTGATGQDVANQHIARDSTDKDRPALTDQSAAPHNASRADNSMSAPSAQNSANQNQPGRTDDNAVQASARINGSTNADASHAIDELGAAIEQFKNNLKS